MQMPCRAPGQSRRFPADYLVAGAERARPRRCAPAGGGVAAGRPAPSGPRSPEPGPGAARPGPLEQPQPQEQPPEPGAEEALRAAELPLLAPPAEPAPLQRAAVARFELGGGPQRSGGECGAGGAGALLPRKERGREEGVPPPPF